MPKKAGGSSKRAKAFAKKGGIKGALKSGTVSKKGKFRRGRREDKKGGKGGNGEEGGGDGVDQPMVGIVGGVRNGYKRGDGGDDVEGELTTATELGKMDIDTFLNADFDESEESEDSDGGNYDEDEEDAKEAEKAGGDDSDDDEAE